MSFDEEADRRLTEFVDRYHVTNVPVPRAPFGDSLGAHRAEAIQFYRTVFAYLEKKGWAKRAYLYMLDEPNDAEVYERVRQLGTLVHEAAPGLRRLVVEQPYTENLACGVLDGAVDIWCPLFGFIDEPSVERVRGQGNSVWSYSALVQSAPQPLPIPIGRFRRSPCARSAIHTSPKRSGPVSTTTHRATSSAETARAHASSVPGPPALPARLSPANGPPTQSDDLPYAP